MSELPATELLPLPAAGRTFSAGRTVRLGDVDPAGELRLDAIARYLQDVASDDAIDAGLSNALGWVVRRTMIRIDRPLTVGEPLSLVTFCTGTGRSWAERRTTIADQHGAAVEAVSVWVHVDPDSGRPARLGHDFAGIYGAAAARADRVVEAAARECDLERDWDDALDVPPHRPRSVRAREQRGPLGGARTAPSVRGRITSRRRRDRLRRAGRGRHPDEGPQPSQRRCRRASRRCRAVVGGRRSRRHGPSLDAVRAAG